MKRLIILSIIISIPIIVLAIQYKRYNDKIDKRCWDECSEKHNLMDLIKKHLPPDDPQMKTMLKTLAICKSECEEWNYSVYTFDDYLRGYEY